MPMTIVAFDFDETLTTKDTVVPFLKKVVGRFSFALICVKNLIKITSLLLKKDRDSIKKLFVSEIFTGKEVDIVEEFGTLYAAQVVVKYLRADTVERMRWHQEQGHVVVLVSASLSSYLHSIGDLLEVDAVLCTELQAESGILTGLLAGQNCRGDEKVSRIKLWMQESGFSEEKLNFAYGDSSGDVALLNYSEMATNVRRKDIARSAAC